MTLFAFAKQCFRCLYHNCVVKPKAFVYLVSHNELYKSRSYFQEEHPNKTTFRIFLEQCRQILKYGAPNKFYFMYGFDVKTIKEQDAYVNYSEFMKVRNRLNLASPHNSTCILRNKLYFSFIANAIGIKTPRILVYADNGVLFSELEHKIITLIDFLKGKEYTEKTLFCKSIDGECGEGIFTLRIEAKKILVNNTETSEKELQCILHNGRILIQELIVQHPEMKRLYDQSINTIRLVTVRDVKNGQIVVLPSILRVGANGNKVDNTSQGGIAIGFDLETGRLHKYGFFPEYGLKAISHPNSGICFENFVIPNINEVVKQAKYFHSFLQDIHSIGWDVAISLEGPVFIEGNDNWEINAPQIACNRGLRKEFETYFIVHHR